MALLLAAALTWIAAPLWTAWSLREAVRSGDTAYLERKVEWDSVRASLKASLVQHAQLVPEITAPETGVRPGLWQRVKVAFGQSLIDSFVERTITPKGLPQLFEARRSLDKTVRDASEDAESQEHLERFKRFWARLKRAELQSPTRLEIEMEDKRNPARRIVSLFELRDLEWKLTGLRVVSAPQTPAPDPAPPHNAVPATTGQPR